jgi:hypothetical protein
MIGAVDPVASRERLLVLGDRGGQPPGGLVGGGQVRTGTERVGVIRALHAYPVGERALVQGDCELVLLRRAITCCQRGSRPENVDVVGTAGPLEASKSALAQSDCLCELP